MFHDRITQTYLTIAGHHDLIIFSNGQYGCGSYPEGLTIDE
jgi:hypothetical protein